MITLLPHARHRGRSTPWPRSLTDYRLGCALCDVVENVHGSRYAQLHGRHTYVRPKNWIIQARDDYSRALRAYAGALAGGSSEVDAFAAYRKVLYG